MNAATVAAIPRLAGASDLELAARRVLEGLYHGRHRSPHTGSAIEFSDHRPYLPGDDLRAVDWKAFARSDRLVVRRFHVERDLPLVLVLDASASMDYGAPRKKDWAATAVAALALLAIDQGDRVRLLIDGGILRDAVPSGGGPAQIPRVCAALAQTTWTQPGDLAELITAAGRACERRCLIVVVSDWLSEPDDLRPALATVSGRGHELVALQVLDRSEVALPTTWGHARLRDPEGRHEPLTCDAVAAKSAYDAAIAAHLSSLRATLTACHGEHLLAVTDEDPVAILGTWLRRRRRVA